MAVEAAGAVRRPGTIDPDENYTSPGWAGVFGFLDGLKGATDRVSDISGDYAEITGNVTDGRRSIFELKRDKEIHRTDQFLQKLKVQRGDNVQLYYVAGAVALFGVLMLMDR